MKIFVIIVVVFIVVYYLVMPLLARSYEKKEKKNIISVWDDFKKKNPSDASAIENYYDDDMSSLSDKDALDRIQSIKRLCRNMECTIPELRNTFMKELDKYPIRLLPKQIEITKEQIPEEMHTYLITESKNTSSALLISWIKQRIASQSGNNIASTFSTVSEPDNIIETPVTYWEKYQIDNPEKAREIMSLDIISFKDVSDDDAREKIKAIELTAKDSNCSISELKDTIKRSFERTNVKEEEVIQLIERFDKLIAKEAEEYNIKKENTFNMVIQKWVMDRVEEIEKKYSSLPPRSKKKPEILLMQFQLENMNEYSVYRKMHIYLKNYPMTDDAKDMIQQIEEAYAPYYDEELGPITPDDKLRQNPSMFNMYIQTKAQMVTDSIKNKNDYLNQNIETCNDVDVSFYEEIAIIEAKAVAKYSI